MAREVKWLPGAIDDLHSIAEHIAADSPAHAAAVVARVISLAAELARFPLSHRRVPKWNDENIRQRIVYSFRLIFRVRANRVDILAIIHGARLLPAELRDRSYDA